MLICIFKILNCLWEWCRQLYYKSKIIFLLRVTQFTSSEKLPLAFQKQGEGLEADVTRTLFSNASLDLLGQTKTLRYCSAISQFSMHWNDFGSPFGSQNKQIFVLGKTLWDAQGNIVAALTTEMLRWNLWIDGRGRLRRQENTRAVNVLGEQVVISRPCSVFSLRDVSNALVRWTLRTLTSAR